MRINSKEAGQENLRLRSPIGYPCYMPATIFNSPRSLIVFGVALVLTPWLQAEQPYGIPKRVPWTTSRLTGTPEPPPPYRIERAFPKLHFKNSARS